MMEGLAAVSVTKEDWADVREECERVWSSRLKGCERVSLTNRHCSLAAHPQIGETVTEKDK